MMTPDRIKQMAQEAGIVNDARNLEHMPTLVESLEAFAQLVAEDCAKVVLSRGRVFGFSQGISPAIPSQPMSADGIAEAIRARYSLKD